MKKTALILFLLLFVLGGCGAKGYVQLQNECESNNAIWQADYHECDDGGISSAWDMKDWCDKNGGAYNNCASPCRHFENKGACIQVCYRMCSY